VFANGRVDLGDAIAIVVYLFGNGPEPECLDAADTNDDAVLGNPHGINIGDAIYLLQYLFKNGPPPPEPFGSAEANIPLDCGVDPQVDDGLDCRQYPLCE
jgi:hypothetical protein